MQLIYNNLFYQCIRRCTANEAASATADDDDKTEHLIAPPSSKYYWHKISSIVVS